MGNDHFTGLINVFAVPEKISDLLLLKICEQKQILDYYGADGKELQLMDDKPCHWRLTNTFKALGLNTTANTCVSMVV